MTFAVIWYAIGWKRLQGIGDHAPDPATVHERNRFFVLLAAVVVFIFGFAALLGLVTDWPFFDRVATTITIFILIVPFVYFFQLFRRQDYTPRERSHVRAFIWIFPAAAAF